MILKEKLRAVYSNRITLFYLLLYEQKSIEFFLIRLLTTYKYPSDYNYSYLVTVIVTC